MCIRDSTTGGHDGIAVIQNTATLGSVISGVTQASQIRMAGKNSGGADVTIASFNVESIGGSDVPILRCDGDIVAFNSSDINLKENIPFLGPILFGHSIILYFAFLLPFLTNYFLKKTKLWKYQYAMMRNLL